MNRTLIVTWWRERFTSIIRMALLAAVWGFSILFALYDREGTVPDGGSLVPVAMILGAGVIGRDLSTGVLQLILARPVTRLEYVLSRWAALSLATLAVGVAGWLIVLGPALSKGQTFLSAAGALGGMALTSFGLAAVLTGLSALLPGFGDLALLAIGAMFGGGLHTIGTIGKQPAFVRAARELNGTLFPTVDFERIVVDGSIHSYPLVVWASTLTLFLLLGIWAMNRREFSYGSAG